MRRISEFGCDIPYEEEREQVLSQSPLKEDTEMKIKKKVDVPNSEVVAKYKKLFDEGVREFEFNNPAHADLERPGVRVKLLELYDIMCWWKPGMRNMVLRLKKEPAPYAS